ncbi:MAG: HD domain-containing protein [Patescibacteria group bacterium]
MKKRQISAPKVVADPIYGIIDIRPVLPMMETQEFQALGDKRQLGMSYLTFPSATHTRKAHSLGAYHATRKLADRWLELGFIKEDEADALSGYALYHDIGHPAFSHVVEDLCDKDNDALGLEIIRGLRGAIEEAGINYELLESMARHENPLYLAVHDKNLGTEKLDYLERDGLATILSRPSGIDYLREHIYFIDGELAIDEKVVDNAIEAQNFYLKMYKNVYLRKTSAIAQRMFQKTVYYLLLAGEITKKDLPTLTDSELLGIMRLSKNPVVQELYDMLKRRELFREAIVIRPEKFANLGTANDKAIATFGLKDDEVRKLMKSSALDQKNQAGLGELEKKIANIAGIPEAAVLVVPVFNPGRFQAKDVRIHKDGRISSLKERYPAHFQNMEEVAQSYIALRICVPEKYRKQLSDPKTAKEVLDIVMKSSA